MEREPMLGARVMSSRRKSLKNSSQKLTCFVYLLTFLSGLGGFLFGYDTGVVSGVLVIIKDEFHMSSLVQEIFVSITLGSAMVFSLVSGFINDYFGRKITILIASMNFLIGSVVLGCANSVTLLLIGRFIVGVGIGLSSAAIPMYIAECSPRNIRGQLVSVNTLLTTGGQFISCLVCGLFSYDMQNGWRFMMGLSAIPALIQFIFFIFMPESPRWLYCKGDADRARLILHKIEGDDDVVEEDMEDIRLSLISEADESSIFTYFRIMKTSHVRRALFIGVMLQLIQQFVGINTVMYYSATIIQMSGISDASKAIWLASLVASVNFLFTFVGLVLVEKIGRRKLIIFSLLGTVFSLLVLGTGFLLSSIYSPPITFNTSQSICANFGNCNDCVTNPCCGFCYDITGSHNATCMPLPEQNLAFSSLDYLNVTPNNDFQCGNKTNQIGWELYSKFCPTKFAWMCTFGLIIYLAFFAPGMGPMPWTINSEIYPGWARSSGNSISTCINWLSNLLVSMTFLTLTETIAVHGAFYLYACLALMGLLFLFLVLPETRGKSLEEIEDLFRGSLLIPCRKITLH